jgi:hypothetical protein
MTSINPPTSPRSPMKSIIPNQNIPQIPPQKSIQLGIESFTKKRERQNLETNPNPRIKKIKVDGETKFIINGESKERDSVDRQGLICHQCRTLVHTNLSVQCTALKTTGGSKNLSVKRCTISYCQRCLLNRYEEKLADITAHWEMSEGHVDDAGYAWSCPTCRKECNCSVCRKKMGLEPTG